MEYKSADKDPTLLGLLGNDMAINDARETAGEMWDSMNWLQQKSLQTSMLPVIPDLLGLAGDAQMFYQEPETRTPLNYGMSAAGMLPFMAGAGMTARAGKVKAAPQDEALKTAQKNAALPTSEGGLGLSANNSPLERAEAMGFDTDTDWYHGSTHDIPSFGGGTANPEGYLGGGHYFTDSTLDASENYAGMGADLTGRVEQRAEQIAQDVMDERGVSEAVADRYSHFKAKSELVGDNSGAVYPSLLRSEKTLDITPDNQSMLGYDELNPEDFMGDARDAVDIDGFMDDGVLDEDMYKEALDESARDIAIEDASYRDPEGELADIRSGLVYSSYEDMDGGAAFDETMEQFGVYPGSDESIGAGDLIDSLKESEHMSYAIEPDSGLLASGQAIADAVDSAGYSGILMDADKAFGNQSGRANIMDMDYGTQHMIMQDPSRIRSRYAAFDPLKRNSANILAGVGGIGLTSLLGYNKSQEDPYAWAGL